MTQKTKAILKHTGIFLLCLIIGTGVYFLARHFYGTLGGGTSQQSDKGLQLLGYFLYLICFLIGVGAFVHLRMIFSNARVHCKNCGQKTYLKDYQILKRNMASDNIHVLSEVIQLNMCCSSCGAEFHLKKKFHVSSYNSKHHVWKIVDVDKAVREYSLGKLWF
ncbi:MAG: hypothetical protein J5589_11965 [Firmicutes bacterium]|nr:hypothetical protein [Bacillota bacterium]